MIKQLTIFASTYLCASGAQARLATNVVDIASLAACTNSDASAACFTNGWECLGIDSYKDQTSVNPFNVRLSEKGDYIVSTNFSFAIVEILLKVHSSSSAGRRLSFEPWIDGEFSAGAAAACDYSENKDTYVWRTVRFPEGVEATRFRMRLNSEGGSTGWGVSYMAVVCDEDPFAAPSELSVVASNCHRCVLSWINGAGTLSNRVQTVKYEFAGLGDETEELWDFSFVRSPGGSTKPITDDVLARFPGIDGENLYAPANTEGKLQLGTGTKPGTLVLPASGQYEDRVLRIVAKRYPGDEAQLPVSWISGAETNSLASVTLPADDFEARDVPLGDVAPGARLALNFNARPSNKRVLLTSAALVCTNAPQYMASAVAPDRFFPCPSPAPAAPFQVTRAIDGLQPRGRYGFAVWSFGEGGEAKGGASTPAVELPREKGAQVFVR